jgi:hypothetical protein
MARFHLLWPAASALLTLAVQAAPFTPVAPVAAAVPAPVGVAGSGTVTAQPATGPSAKPADTPRPMLWLCSLSERLTQLLCVADADPVEQADPRDARDAVEADPPSAPPVTAQVRGTRFPLDPQQLWVVDLWTPPTAADDLALLARATICYRSPGCEVRLTLPDLGGRAGARLAQAPRWRSR